MSFDYRKLFIGPISDRQLILVLVLSLWAVFWKGLALWRSARKGQKYWFVVLLILNSFGIIEIIYLAFFQKGRKIFAERGRRKKKTRKTS